MSRTYSLVCRETKSRIWIGQGWGPMEGLYCGEDKTMANLRLFLNAHEGKQIQFLCNDTNFEVYDYEDWSDRPIANDDEFGQMLARTMGPRWIKNDTDGFYRM